MQSRVIILFQHVGVAFVSRRLLAVLVITSALVVAPSVFAADDYLSELDAEAESSAGVPNGDNPGSAQGGDASNPAQAARMEFEHALRGTRPSIYTFYGRLSDSGKAQVVERYAKSAENMGKAVNLILDLYFKKK